jgi:hypothetical protein
VAIPAGVVLRTASEGDGMSDYAWGIVGMVCIVVALLYFTRREEP